LSLSGRLLRRRLRLPPAAARVVTSRCAVAADDGARLDTQILRPLEAGRRRGCVLVRAERPPESGGPALLLARFLAEDGATVVWQSCRGRGRSEGDFRPFADEVRDGGAAIRWITGQPWFDGRLSLFGLGYSAHTAWAALAAAPHAVDALAAGFGARDPHAWLHPGGGLHVEVALALSASLHAREGADVGSLDLARAGRFLPLRESDRVAWREIPAFREWIRHPDPEADAYWADRTPPLPERPPAVLQIAGWYEPANGAALADHRRLAERAAAAGSAAPALCVGPWAAVELPRSERARDAATLAHIARATLRFLARGGGDPAPRAAAVRVHVLGAGWRELGSWPPERAETRSLHLRGGGGAQSADGDGRLDAAPAPADEPADVFVSDPADPVPSRGGIALAAAPGPAAQTDVEGRGDVLCFTGEPLAQPLELAGPVRATLHVATSAESADFTAKLLRVDAVGVARWLAEGVAVCAGDGGAAQRVVIDLGSAAARVGAGERLRLMVASSSLPRFARSAQTAKPRADAGPGEGRAARQTLFHDAARPSLLELCVLPARAPAPADVALASHARDAGAGDDDAQDAPDTNETGPPAAADGPVRSSRRPRS